MADVSKVKKKIDEFISSKKWKSLLAVVEATDGLLVEEKTFFIKYKQQIWEVFYERWKGFLSSKKSAKLSDYIESLGILKKILVQLEDEIKAKWNLKEIEEIIHLSLHFGNKHSLRVAGFDCLCIFLEDLKTIPKSQLSEDPSQWLFRAINWEPFAQDSKIKLNNIEKNTGAPLSSSSTPPSKTEGIEILQSFLDFISTRSTQFFYWFSILKEGILSFLFPGPCQLIGLKNVSEGFESCPPEISKLFIERIGSWLNNGDICSVLLKEDNSPILLELLKQVCSPSSSWDTIRPAIESYKSWLLNSFYVPAFGTRLQSNWIIWIECILKVPTIPCKPEEMAIYKDVIKNCFDICNVLCFEFGSQLQSKTWLYIQNQILLNVSQIEAKLSFFAPELLTKLFEVLFLIWIASPETKKEMWAQFQLVISSLSQRSSELILQWKEKLIQLTFILRDFVYNVATSELLSGPRRTGKASTQVEKSSLLEGLSWNTERITTIWFIILDVVGSVNKIKDNSNHETAIGCMKEVVELLLQAEYETCKYDDDGPIPIVNIFSPIFFEASTHENNIKAVALSINALCQMFCVNRAKAIEQTILSSFYKVLYQGLNSSKEPIILEIISGAKNLFSLALPGSSLLISDFCREIDKLFISGGSNPQKELDALGIICSLIAYPYHFESSSGAIQWSFKQTENLSIEKLRTKIAAILYLAIRRDAPSVKARGIWGFAILLSYEIQSTNSNKSIIDANIKELLSLCSNSNQEVARTALGAISTLSHLFKEIDHLNINLPTLIIIKLCENLINAINQFKSDFSKPMDQVSPVEYIIADYFLCLQEWLSHDESNLLYDPALSNKLFTAIEMGLFGELVPLLDLPKFEKEPSKKEKKKKTPLTSAFSFRQLRDHPSHNSEIIREAAEILYFWTLIFYHNYPGPGGPEQIFSDIPDKEEEGSMFFLFDDSRLFSIHDFKSSQPTSNSNNGSPNTCLIVRDCAGKFAWDFEFIPSIDPPPPIKDPYSFLAQSSINKKPKKVVSPDHTKQVHQRANGEIPIYSPDLNYNNVDMVDELLHYLAEAHSECLPNSARISSFHKPLTPSPIYKTSIEEMTQIIDEQTRLETLAETNQSLQSPSEVFSPPFTSVAQDAVESFCYSRILLSHLGLLSIKTIKKIHAIGDGLRFRRVLKDFDRLTCRQQFKVGVVLVKEGQEDQKSIFKNESGSKEYLDFINSLGWPIDLNTHKGFLGGLESSSCGISAPYWADSNNEIIFHVGTKIPTIDSDPQQIQKKRHIGNDNVHIVWSEHKRDYNPQTITSQFNDVHIIIYPLNNGLYRIQNFIKEKNIQFLVGPLFDELVVTKAMLPFLVRTTACNSNRLVRFNTKGYKHPYSARQDLLEEVQKYQSQHSFENFMTQVFPSESGSAYASRFRSSTREPVSPTKSNEAQPTFSSPTVSHSIPSPVPEKVETSPPPKTNLNNVPMTPSESSNISSANHSIAETPSSISTESKGKKKFSLFKGKKDEGNKEKNEKNPKKCKIQNFLKFNFIYFQNRKREKKKDFQYSSCLANHATINFKFVSIYFKAFVQFSSFVNSYLIENSLILSFSIL